MMVVSLVLVFVHILVLVLVAAMVMPVRVIVVPHGYCPAPSIRPIAIAAPNPLSMFTTVTPAAQLANIAKSDVIPPRCAP